MYPQLPQLPIQPVSRACWPAERSPLTGFEQKLGVAGFYTQATPDGVFRGASATCLSSGFRASLSRWISGERSGLKPELSRSSRLGQLAPNGSRVMVTCGNPAGWKHCDTAVKKPALRRGAVAGAVVATARPLNQRMPAARGWPLQTEDQCAACFKSAPHFSGRSKFRGNNS